MTRRAGVLALALCALAAVAGAADKPDQVQGNWEGKFTSPEYDAAISAKVIALGDNDYRMVFETEGNTVELQGKGDGGAGVFFGRTEYEGAPLLLTAVADDGRIQGAVAGFDEPLPFELQRVEKKSPTLGAQPPQGAVVIFDGRNQDKWKAMPEKWALGDGEMHVANPSLITVDEYGSGTYHVEFKTPLMAEQRGQGRGNSGVYLLGRYEVQVLDSFGLPPADNEAGGIYKMATPRVNASLPPEEWQTYDITFTAAQFDASGKKIQDATLTADHNGIRIHDNVKLTEPTPGGVSDKDAAQGPLLLQNHGNPVAYRNIWFAPAPAP